MKNIPNLIENILIIAFIVVGSFPIFFAEKYSFADEILIILIIFWAILKRITKGNMKINTKTTAIMIIFIMTTMINLFINQYDASSYIKDFLNYFKIIVLFEGFKLIELDKKRFDFLLNVFFLINMLSIFYGILTYVFYKSPYLIYGHKYRNGKYRIMGLSGHPITLSIICLFNIIFIIKSDKKIAIKLIVSMLSIYALVLTQSRLAEMLLIIFLFVETIQYINKRINTISKRIVLIGICGVALITAGLLFYNFALVKDYYSDDIENTIRMHALIKSGEIFKEYPLLGTGIGTFGSNNSVKYNYNFVYEKFHIRRSFIDLQYRNNLNVFESYFAFVLIETRSQWNFASSIFF